jgi:PAS domain S-box-containing protein
MLVAPTPPEEAERLRALDDYGILDTPPEPVFDELAALAARICDTPISLVTLIDRNRQWFKAHHGFAPTETPRDGSFGAHVLGDPDRLLLVPDATRDPRFLNNPQVVGEPGIRFYAGVPLGTPEGYVIGSLCVIDRQPRTLGSAEQAALGVLGRQVMAQLKLRRSLNATNLHLARLENSQRIAGLGDWEYDFARRRLHWSDEVYRILGIGPRDSPPDAETFYRLVHPADRAFVRQTKKKTSVGFCGVDFEHRIIRPDGKVRHLHQITEMVLDVHGGPARESGTVQDITERKLSEEALHESEERYRLIFERNPSPVWVFDDATSAFLAVNDAVLALYGYSRKEMLRMKVTQVRPPEMLLDSLEPFESSAPGSSRFRADGRFHHRKKDGTIIQVDVFAHGVDFAGRPARLELGVDVTESERAAAALRASEARFRALSESAPIGIFECDEAGRVIYNNPALTALWGRPAAEILGCGWGGNIHPDDRAATSASWARAAAAGSTWDQESRLLRPDNSVRWVRTLIAPGKAARGRVTGFVGTVEDITARQQALTALRESEERFKFVTRAVSDVVWDWNFTANTFWWNDGFLTTFGFAAGEVAPSVEFWTGRIHPDERARVVKSVHQLIETGAESWSADYRFQRKDGSYAFVHDRGHILRDAAGRGVRMVGGMSDLTEQKKTEAQYLRAQRMESIGTLAGGIAHDLNNVLAPILMSIELLRGEEVDEARRQRILDIIDVSSRRGADLVHQVLSFAKGLDGPRVAVRLRRVIEDLERVISQTFPRSIAIAVNAPPDLWSIIGNASQIHQLLLNLAVNARDAMPHGGKLTLSAANITVDSQFAGTSPGAKAGTYLLLQVIDTGQGIPPEVRERIFEPFFTTKELGKGTGLGLATVHTVVRSHGGFLNVESEMGRGTTFNIYLPANPVIELPDSAHPIAAVLPRGRDELILVVDDESSIREITQQTLETFGYRVVTAADGAEAVALYARRGSEIAMVITDMMMPIMDGPAAIQVLNRINPAVKIIAASGNDARDGVAKARSAGVMDLLRKPYTAATLLKLVRSVLDRPPSGPDG